MGKRRGKPSNLGTPDEPSSYRDQFADEAAREDFLALPEREIIRRLRELGARHGIGPAGILGTQEPEKK